MRKCHKEVYVVKFLLHDQKQTGLSPESRHKLMTMGFTLKCRDIWEMILNFIIALLGLLDWHLSKAGRR